MSNLIIDALFRTNAIRVCMPDQPFWYTSGMLGPFYINTHFLYGSEEEASELLRLIETAAYEDRLTFPSVLLDVLKNQYATNQTFRLVTDQIVSVTKTLPFDCISGGERRDFFFSLLPAAILGKPHLSIFKDRSAVYTDVQSMKTEAVEEGSVSGMRILHISDLITEASSYERAWIPVIRELGAEICDTITVVNRKQDGESVLRREGVTMHALSEIDLSLFESALSIGAITESQFLVVRSFILNPTDFMSSFLLSHPDFIAQQIALGGKARERAEMAIEKGYAPPVCR